MYASTACKSASLALEVTSRTKEMFTAKMLVNINDMQAYKPEAGWGVQKQKHGGVLPEGFLVFHFLNMEYSLCENLLSCTLIINAFFL